MFKTKTKLMVLFLTVLMILAGCGGKTASNEASEKVTTLKFGTTPWPTSMFAFLADDLGYFKEEGVNVDLQIFSAFGETQQALIGGNLDLITSPSSDTIAPYSQGAKFDVIMLTDKSLGADGMVAKKEINDIKDLKGKTVATELYSVDHMYLLQLLDQAGMSEKDVKLTNMSISDAGTAMISGKVDAAVIWEPYLSRALAEGDTNLLYSSKDTPDLITDSIIVNEKVVKDKKAAVQAFVNSWYRAVDYWKENPEDAEKRMAKHMDVSPEEFHELMKTLYITTAEDTQKSFDESSENSFVDVNTKIAKFLKDLDVIKSVPNVSEMVNPEFVNNIK